MATTDVNASGGLARLRALLAARGLAPRKRLGQNFLVDPNFARAVAAAAEPDARTLCLEVGPGAGALTSALLAAHPQARVLAIELDLGLASLLRELFAAEIAAGRLTLLAGDALAGKHGLNPELLSVGLGLSAAEGRPRRVLCANLPYNIAMPLVANLALPLAGPGEPFAERIVATVQVELAERFCGAPGSSGYGPLAAYLALRAEARIVRRVGPEVFWPRPKVRSAVVVLRLKPWAEAPFGRDEARPFRDFLQRLFLHRRKTVGTLLKRPANLPPEWAAARAEDLPPETLLALHRRYDDGL